MNPWGPTKVRKAHSSLPVCSVCCSTIFCSLLSHVLILSPLTFCLCRKLHCEMGKPHHVLCGQCVCCGCLIGDTHTHIYCINDHHYRQRGVQCVPVNSRGPPSATKSTSIQLYEQAAERKTAVFSSVSSLQMHVNIITLMYLSSHVTAVL